MDSISTLAATLHHLLHNPHAMMKVETEIRSTFNSRDSIRMGADMQGCTYLRACIDETMRMTPAVGGMLPRRILDGGLAIPALGLELPAGVDVGVPIYAVHHHPEYVVEPFLFDPDRWIVQGHAQDRSDLNSIFTPFSLGNRSCLGKPLVYMEISIAIARLVWEYDIRLHEKQHGTSIKEASDLGMQNFKEYQLQDWFMSQNKGPWVRLTTRKAAGSYSSLESAKADKLD